eukprot:CAMPEP_0116139724 /NCGR_PEP_ID=MMETSP0329-20121206/13463_1 /TAXON_ID=697910 /ORGANISM="Pseudo-nitzschia arenysensis, Strain B593" /LENGTH=111 /DNA_ID=CAMNT_0003634783 /DNA_START=57 /DNA_END=392 /DNA_ORIENTATION=-
MKFGLSSATLIAVLATASGENPDCKLSAVDGYYNCKTAFYVSGAGSDALWCVSESDCLKVFPEPTSLPTLMPTEAPIAISSVEQAIISSSTMAKATSAALLVVAATMAALW